MGFTTEHTENTEKNFIFSVPSVSSVVNLRSFVVYSRSLNVNSALPAVIDTCCFPFTA